MSERSDSDVFDDEDDDPGFLGGGGPASVLDDDEVVEAELDRAGDNLQRVPEDDEA